MPSEEHKIIFTDDKIPAEEHEGVKRSSCDY